MASMQTALGNTAYVLDHNKKRLLILFVVLGGAIGLYGIRGIFQGILDMIGQAPQLLVLLLFYSFMMIVQFGALMWFMSRPRTYTVTPDNPQIGLSFENYRGQPDLLEHAKSLVRILKGVKTFQDRGGEMPRGCCSPGRPAPARPSSPACMAAEANLPFIYVDASSLSGMFMGIDALIVISLFRKARGLARKYATPGQPGCCILFLDELDPIGLSRGGTMGGGSRDDGSDGHDGRPRPGAEHDAQPDGLSRKARRGPSQVQDRALARLRPRTRSAEARRVRHRRDQPARRARPGARARRPSRPQAHGLRAGRRRPEGHPPALPAPQGARPGDPGRAHGRGLHRLDADRS